MKRRSTPRNLRYNKKDRLLLQGMASAELGDSFQVSYKVRGKPSMPRSTGVMGDEGVRGHSVVLSTNSEVERRRVLTEDVEQLGKVALRMTNTTSSVSRVLIDITPGETHFIIATEQEQGSV